MNQQIRHIAEKQRITNGKRVTPKAQRPPVGIGWIVNNPNVADYVAYSLETSTVTIMTSEHEIIQRCIVTTQAAQHLKFPETNNEKGSLVVWCSTPLSTVPIVIGVVNAVNEKSSLQKGNSFQNLRTHGQDSVIIEGIAEGGIINVIANSAAGASINIKALSKRLVAEFNLYVQGDITIESEDRFLVKSDREFTVELETIEEKTLEVRKAKLSYLMGKGFILEDQYGNQITMHEKGVTVRVNKDGVITQHGGDNSIEKALLGDTTVKMLQDMMTQMESIAATIQTLAVNTSTGMVLPNVPAKMVKVKTAIKKLKNNLNTLKSKNNKLS